VGVAKCKQAVTLKFGNLENLTPQLFADFVFRPVKFNTQQSARIIKLTASHGKRTLATQDGDCN